MRLHAAHHKSATVEEHQHRQHGLPLRHRSVQAGRHGMAATIGNLQILDARQRRRLDLQHVRAHGIGFARQIDGQRLHGRARLSVDALQQVADVRLEVAPGFGLDVRVGQVHGNREKSGNHHSGWMRAGSGCSSHSANSSTSCWLAATACDHTRTRPAWSSI